MQLNVKKLSLNLVVATILFSLFNVVHAAPGNKNTYTEDQFLTAFSGKSKKVITSKLGQPIKKELSVKPAGASTFMAKTGADESKSKPVKVEMWYYKNIVRYDTKRTYKETEITFVNDKAMNIAFFNNR